MTVRSGPNTKPADEPKAHAGAPSSASLDELTAHLDRAWDLVSRGDLAGAQVSARETLEHNPEAPEAHNLMAYVLARSGDAERALEHYEKALDLDDSFVEALLNGAELLLSPLKDYDEAVEWIESALEFQLNDVEMTDALLLLNEAHLFAGRKDEARKVLARLPERSEIDADLEVRLSRAYYDLEDDARALEILRRVVEREPDFGEAHYTLGIVLDTTQRADEATQAFLRARELDALLPSPPWATSRDVFEKRIRANIRALPVNVQEYLKTVLLVFTDRPGAEVVADGFDPRSCVRVERVASQPTAPGGVPSTGSDAAQAADPGKRSDRVFIYQVNLERSSVDGAAIEEEFRRAMYAEMQAVAPEISVPAERPSDNAPAEPGARSRGSMPPSNVPPSGVH